MVKKYFYGAIAYLVSDMYNFDREKCDGEQWMGGGVSNSNKTHSRHQS